MPYDLLEKFGDMMSYCDIERFIFLSRDGDWIRPLGPSLDGLRTLWVRARGLYY